MHHLYLSQKHKFLTGKNIFFLHFIAPFLFSITKKDSPQPIIQLYGGALFEIN